MTVQTDGLALTVAFTMLIKLNGSEAYQSELCDAQFTKNGDGRT